jgi:hypothetical protein
MIGGAKVFNLYCKCNRNSCVIAILTHRNGPNNGGGLMANPMEAQIEKVINQITSSDLFLRTISTLINFNSYRKIWVQKSIEKILKELELPVRRDQEKLLALVQELEIRVKKLQLNEENQPSQSVSRPSLGRQVIVQKRTKAKKAPAKRIN